MKLTIFHIFLISLLYLTVLSVNTHTRKEKSGHIIHPKFFRMVFDPNWGDKTSNDADGSAEPGVIHSQLQKVEEYRIGELKKGLNKLRRRNIVSGGCRSKRI